MSRNNSFINFRQNEGIQETSHVSIQHITNCFCNIFYPLTWIICMFLQSISLSEIHNSKKIYIWTLILCEFNSDLVKYN